MKVEIYHQNIANKLEDFIIYMVVMVVMKLTLTIWVP